MDKKNKNTFINSYYSQPAGNFDRYEVYFKCSLTKPIILNSKVNNYSNQIFQKNNILIINKSTRVLCRDTTIADHINTNWLFLGDMYCGSCQLTYLMTCLFLLIFKNVGMNSSQNSFYIITKKVKDKSTTFINLFC